MFQFLGAVYVQDLDITILPIGFLIFTNLSGPAFSKPNLGGKQTLSIDGWHELCTAILGLRSVLKSNWQKPSLKRIKVA